MSDRTAGLRGRLPVRAEKFAIRWLHEYAVPAAPTYPVDVSKGITAFGMDGNDTVGDCGPCAWAHDRMLAGTTMTAQEVIDLYLAYTGGQDVGVVLADFLLYLFHQGLLEGFAPVELTTVDAVMGQFQRGVILGVNLTADANTLFNEGKPWTVANGETPDPAEGHAILKTGAVTATGNGVVVTWGALQVTEYGWEQACVEEAWAIVTKDDMGETGYAALLADLQALPSATVTPVPPAPEPPAPPVQPPPVVPPAPVPDIHGFIAEIHQIVDEAKQKLIAAAEAIIHALEHP